MRTPFSSFSKGSTRSPAALTIAGSDCSGGAGIQADLQTFAAFQIHGMAVVTCVVAENPKRVRSIEPLAVSTVRDQLFCCLENTRPMPAKTGMLYSAPIIRACHRALSSHLGSRVSMLVVDPVMVSTSGTRLLQSGAVRELFSFLENHADLVTPNLNEAEILAEQSIATESHMVEAAEIIARRFGCSVLIKGGHLRNPNWAIDYLHYEDDGIWIRSRRIRGVKTHGTGCCYSAAITANLALGYLLPDAVRRAKRFVSAAIRHSRPLGAWTALNFT